MFLDDFEGASPGLLRDPEPENGADCVRRARQAARRGELRAAVALYERALSIDGREASLWRDGEFWQLRFGGETIVLADTKGVHYLARLVRRPRRPIPALLLASAEESRALEKAYTRLRELEGALSAAEDDQDVGRTDSLHGALAWHREAIDDLVRRARHSCAAESARVRVTQSLRSTIERITREHPVLGVHLDATIRTGAACTYALDPVAPSIDWDVRP